MSAGAFVAQESTAPAPVAEAPARLDAAEMESFAEVGRKLARLDAMIGRAHLSAAERARMRKASRDILRLVLADRRREASRRISNLMRQLAR